MNDYHDHDDRYAGRYHEHHDDQSIARGLREDLGRAEQRISDLEEEHASDIRKLWDHISRMPGGI